MRRTEVLEIDPKDPQGAVLKYCAEVIRRGGLVVFPTETVYGIAANYLDKKAIGRLYKVKERSRTKPFTVHVAEIAAIKRMGCKIGKEAKALMNKFWPGPLTIILKSKTGASIGFRMPANRVALGLIRKAAVPVAAPSANLGGNKAPVSAQEALRDLDGKADIVIDAGPSEIGIESTVVDMTVVPPRVLREGAISAQELMRWAT